MLNINKKTTTDNKIIANHFNEFFISIARKITGKILTPKSTFHSYLTKTNEKSFFINPTTSEEIEGIVSSFQTNKATGPRTIPIKTLKDLKKNISKPLADLVNLSFNFGKFLNCIETATVIPIFKKVDQQNCNNYISTYLAFI